MKDFSVVKHGGHHECAYQPAENASINDDAFCRYLTLEFNEALVHIVHSILCGMLFPAESSPGEDDSPLFYVTQEILASDHKARRLGRLTELSHLRQLNIRAPEQAAPYILLDGHRPLSQMSLFS